MEQKLILLLVSLLAILCAGSNETQVQWTNWCDTCKCVTSDESLNIDCTKVWPKETPQTWPQEFIEDKNLSEKTLIVTIRYNDIKKLEPLPEIKAKRVAISFKKCDLEEISYAAFRKLKNIYILNLSFNKLTGEAMRGEIFKGPYDNNNYEPIDLEVLHLESNLIHSLDRNMFEHTPMLRSLYLSDNPIEVLDSVTVLSLTSIKKLEVLDLSFTGLSVLPDDLMRNSKLLRELKLSGNKFKTVPESLGSIGSSLKILTLNNNQIEEINDNSFLGLWRLEYLEVGIMETLKKVKAGSFAQLRSLKMLHVCNNKNLRMIDHDAFRELKEHWPIKELYLHDNNLETISGDLAPWDLLNSVSLENNAWVCDCRMAINIATKGIARKISHNTMPRCMSPMSLAGTRLADLNPDKVCLPNERNNTIGPSRYHPIRNLTGRPGSIMLALGFVCSVVILGLCLGCLVSYIRNKFKRVTLVQSVRYTHLIT